MIQLLALLVAAFAITACTPPGGSSPANRQNPAAPGTPAGPQQGGGQKTPTLGGAGTFDGGGGNGIDGRPIESYSKSIESLPEYKRFILPVLRKLSIGKPDVLVAYLTWAARQKAWYFVPVELPTLPKDRIQLAFQSDQLALHSDQEIFIHAPSYDAKPAEDRARLLLHEMVMAARLLMKKSPQKQCEALSKSTQLSLCKDPESLKTAAAVPGSETAEARTLNGIDHEGVRMMTVFLADLKSELNAEAVYAMRARLNFSFPWDSSISNIGAAEVDRALKRSELAQDLFVSESNYAIKDQPSTCLFQRFGYQGDVYYYATVARPLKPEVPIENSVLTSGPIDYAQITYGYLGMIPLTTAAGGARIEAAGVRDPSNENEMVDRVRIYTGPNSAWRDKGSGSLIVDFYLKRGEPRRISEIHIIPARILEDSSAQTSPKPFKDMEYVPVRTYPMIRCKLANP